MKTSLFARLVVVMAVLLPTVGLSRAAEVIRLKFAAGQDEFELSAVAGGVQTLSLAASAAEVQWADPSVVQKFSHGRLMLVVPIAAGEAVVTGKPQPAADGSTVFVFARLTAPSVAAAPPASPPAAPAAPSARVAPLTLAAAVSPTPAATPASSSAPTPAPAPAPAPAAGGVVNAAASADLKAAVEQLLPGPVKFDPLALADFAIPDSPGAAVLDQTAQIVQPSSPRETVTSLLSHFEHGALKTGFSVAVTPYTLFRAQPVTLTEYNESPQTRFLTRLQLSLAAKTGTTPTSSTATTPALFGVGISGVFFDDSDPRLDKTLFANLKQLFPTSWTTTPEARDAFARGEAIVIPPVEQRKLDAYKAIVAAARRANWNAAAMSFGYGMRLNSPSGQIEDAREDGGGAWLNYGHPGFGSLRQNSQFLFTASYRYHDPFTRDGVSGFEDTFNLAAQMRVGARDFNGYGQVVYHWRDPKSQPRTHDATVEFGLERRIFDGVWLNLGWSNDSFGAGSAVKAGLRYGFGQAASLGPVN